MSEHESVEPEAAPESSTGAEPSLELDTGATQLAGRDAGHRRRLLRALQRSAGNQSVLALLRSAGPEPAGAGRQAAAAATRDDPESVRAALGGGEALPERVRQEMERAFAADFADVQVHADATGEAVSRALGAHAVTVGRHIAFAPGRYGPGTPIGDALIAHELAHVIQQSAGAPSAGGPAFERDAQAATVEAMTSLYGERAGLRSLARTARPRLRGGLALQRCDLSAPLPDVRLSGKEAADAIAGADLELVPSRAPDPAPTGLVVSYRLSAIDAMPPYYVNSWWVSPPGDDKLHRVSGAEGNPQMVVVTMDKPGEWTVAGEVTVDRVEVDDPGCGGGKQTVRKVVMVEATQVVEDIEKVAATDFTALDSRPTGAVAAWDRYRAVIATQRAQIAGRGVRDQNFGGPYITLDQGENPASKRDCDPGRMTNLKPYTYTVHADPTLPADAEHPSHFRWYAIPQRVGDSPEYNRGIAGLRSTTYNGQKAYQLVGERWITFAPPAEENTWQLVCELMDFEDNVRFGIARYWQVVTTAEQISHQKEQLEKLDTHAKEAAGLYASLSPGTAQPLKAMHVEASTGRATELNLFVGVDAADPSEHKLVDLTYGADRTEYTGSSVDDALSSFESGNKYPAGRIVVEVGGTQRTLKTTGTSTAQEVAKPFGWAAMGFAALGVIALFTPAAVAAPYLFVASAAAAGAEGGIKLADELSRAHPDALGVSLDIAQIATSMIGAGVGGAAIKAGTRGITAIQGSRYLIFAGLGGDVVQGVLIAVDSGREIDRILNDEGIPHEKRFDMIVRILTMLVVQGGLIAFGAHDVKTARTRIGELLEDKQLVRGELSSDALGGLDALNDNVLRGLKGATPAELEHVGAVVRADRDAITRLAADYPEEFAALAKEGGLRGDAGAIGEELGRRRAAKSPVAEPPPGAAEVHQGDPRGRAETSEERLGPGEEPADAMIPGADYSMVNELGEPHEFHVAADGTIYRCSWACVDFFEGLEKRMRSVRERSAATRREFPAASEEREIAADMNRRIRKLRSRAKAYAEKRAQRLKRIDQAKTDEVRAAREQRDEEINAENNTSLQREAGQLENAMSRLEKWLGVNPVAEIKWEGPKTTQEVRQTYGDLLGQDKELREELESIERVTPGPDTQVDIKRRIDALVGRLDQQVEAMLPDQIARARALQVPLGDQTHAVNIGGRTYEKCRARAGSHETVSGAQAAQGYEQHTREVIDEAKRIGHTLSPDPALDEGVADVLNKGQPAGQKKVDQAGAARASHAEKQASLAAPNEPIAVSLPMCFDCYAFFRLRARALGRPQVVADPDMVRVFMPDGRILAPSSMGVHPLRPTPPSVKPVTAGATAQPVQ